MLFLSEERLLKVILGRFEPVLHWDGKDSLLVRSAKLRE